MNDNQYSIRNKNPMWVNIIERGLITLSCEFLRFRRTTGSSASKTKLTHLGADRRHMATRTLASIGSGYGLLPDGTKP